MSREQKDSLDESEEKYGPKGERRRSLLPSKAKQLVGG